MLTPLSPPPPLRVVQDESEKYISRETPHMNIISQV